MCLPYKYREINQSQTISFRVFKLISPVIIFSVVLNIPRFFETVVLYDSFVEVVDDNLTLTIETVSFDVTPLRQDPDYVR